MNGFVYENGQKGRKIKFVPEGIQILGATRPYPVETLLRFSDIAGLEVIDKQMLKKTDTAVAATVGGLLAGPIGIAAGVGIGALFAKATFKVDMVDGTSYVFETDKILFNVLNKKIKIQLASTSQSQAPAARSSGP